MSDSRWRYNDIGVTKPSKTPVIFLDGRSHFLDGPIHASRLEIRFILVMIRAPPWSWQVPARRFRRGRAGAQSVRDTRCWERTIEIGLYCSPPQDPARDQGGVFTRHVLGTANQLAAVVSNADLVAVDCERALHNCPSFEK